MHQGVFMRGLSIIAVICLLAAAAFSYPSSVSNNYANNPPSYNSCWNCHDSYPVNSGSGSGVISGLPANGYVLGQTYHLTLTTSQTGQDRWGFQLTVEYQEGASWVQGGQLICTNTTYTSLSTGTGTAPDFLKHTSSGTFNGQANQASWNFDWTAPASGSAAVTFYYSTLACNGNGGNSGDYCYNVSVPVAASTGTAPDVNIYLQPDSTTLTIPGGGGNLVFVIGVQNLETSAVTADIWTNITLPTGGIYGPVINLANFSLPANSNLNRSRIQAIPGSAPAGIYTYNAYVGDNPSTIWDEDHFTFTKTAVDENGGFSWADCGDDFTQEETNCRSNQSSQVSLSACPNPFNPTASVQFELANAGRIALTVYDIRGREVAELANGWFGAGSYAFDFNAGELPSGMYFARLQSSGEVRTQKLLLVK